MPSHPRSWIFLYNAAAMGPWPRGRSAPAWGSISAATSGVTFSLMTRRTSRLSASCCTVYAKSMVFLPVIQDSNTHRSRSSDTQPLLVVGIPIREASYCDTLVHAHIRHFPGFDRLIHDDARAFQRRTLGFIIAENFAEHLAIVLADNRPARPHPPPRGVSPHFPQPTPLQMRIEVKVAPVQHGACRYARRLQ